MVSHSPPTSGHPSTENDTKDVSENYISEKPSTSELKHSVDVIHGNASNDKSVDTNFQPGVQKAEAITIAWSLKALIMAYVVIWLVYFVQGIVTGVSGALLPYVTSDFAAHSLIPTTGVVSQVVGGVTNLCIAKVLDIFGRPHGFILCAFLATIGLVMAASCNGVEAYAASQVFYTVGINGLGYCLSVFIADTSSLRHRGLMQALLNSPYLITSWLAGPISTSFLNGSGWRWAFGMESILIPVVALPLFGLFMFHYKKAKREGIIPARTQSGHTRWQSVMYYIDEFDVVGLLLISTGFAFFLLPFNLYTMEAKGWSSPLIISFLVFGILFIAAFVVWERFFARVCVTPWAILRDRTVLGTCMVGFVLFVSATCWNSYLSSFLQVVNGLSVTQASYIVQSGTVISVIANLVAGVTISYSGRYKPISLYFALPLIVLGTGLLINFRQPDRNVGYIAMCNIFVNFGFGILMLTVEIGLLAAAAVQQYFAISIALLNLFCYIGSAVGFTISAAIWQGTFPEKLALYLPPESQENLTTIYSSIEEQLFYEWNSPTRLAIQHAYADTWRLLLITGAATWALGLVAMLVWKNTNVKGVKQNKGYVV
ncbi:MFS general substrate transporter [Glarea lozoyensis ATCC 20868]|uniref:MFS general substrate transporter n=1 Tax=Glarea lozoyensis (strain ATCC 20868 / MF5171) TaxID=1116229 RepID=S3D9M8_GLAL2|nr:MFS general substrate transporter [Glarea lozoyensis ATCC 20868]EPE34450.1 MFS general substrate transporter [Glarea lozoyensis ATCC 20868]